MQTAKRRAGLGFIALGMALGLAALGAGLSSATPSVDQTSVIIGQGQVSRSAEFRLKPGTDIVMAQNTFLPGGSTGWHSHPGQAIVVVQSGEVTLSVERTTGGPCKTRTYTAGQSFIEWPANSQNAVNHGSVNTVVAVTFLKVPHLGSARIDRPDPGNC